MSGDVHATRVRASVPQMGAWVPFATVHLAFLVVAAALCMLVLQDVWLVGGLLLTVAGTFVPNLVPRWCVIIALGLSQLWREPSVRDASFYVLLAGVHLLHVISGLVMHMKWNGRVQLIAFMRPLQRYVFIQVVVQSVAVLALFAFGNRRETVPGLSIIGAMMVGVVAVVLARGLRDARRAESRQ